MTTRGPHQGTLFHGGLVFLADFFDWIPQEAIEAYIFRFDVQYALNLEPGAAVSTWTLERYQKLFRDDDRAPASSTTSPPDSSRCSLATSPDSGSTRPTSSATGPASAAPSSWPWRSSGSSPSSSGTSPTPTPPARGPPPTRRAESGAALPTPRTPTPAPAPPAGRRGPPPIIDRFADHADLANRPTYKALITIFGQQCELSGDTVVVKAKTGGDCVQNPSDLDATYDAHKGPGYQVQIAETCGGERGPADHRRAAANRLRVRRPCGHAHARPTGGRRTPPRRTPGRHALHRRRERRGRRGAGRGPDRSGPGPRAGVATGPYGRRLRLGRADRHDRRLPRRPPTDIVFAQRGDVNDACRDAGVGMRWVPVPEAVSDQRNT